MAPPIELFESALTDVGASIHRTTPETFQETVRQTIERPAVGTPLPFDRLSITELDVTVDPTPATLRSAVCGITAATLGIAEYGTLVLGSTPTGSELASLFPTHHVAVLRASDIVTDMESAFDRLGTLIAERRSDFVLATGPSATADMGALVHGAHGPRAVTVVLVEGV